MPPMPSRKAGAHLSAIDGEQKCRPITTIGKPELDHRADEYGVPHHLRQATFVIVTGSDCDAREIRDVRGEDGKA